MGIRKSRRNGEKGKKKKWGRRRKRRIGRRK